MPSDIVQVVHLRITEPVRYLDYPSVELTLKNHRTEAVDVRQVRIFAERDGYPGANISWDAFDPPEGRDIGVFHLAPNQTMFFTRADYKIDRVVGTYSLRVVVLGSD